MKKLNRKQKRTLVLVFAFIALGTAMLSLGVKHSDSIQTKWDEIVDKFDDEEKKDDVETPEVEDNTESGDEAQE